MNIGDPQRAKANRRKQKRDRAAAIADLREVLALEAGRRYIGRVLALCGIETPAWRPDARQTDMQLGVQALGLQLVKELDEVDPALYGALRTERLSRERNARPDDSAGEPGDADTAGDGNAADGD